MAFIGLACLKTRPIPLMNLFSLSFRDYIIWKEHPAFSPVGKNRVFFIVTCDGSEVHHDLQNRLRPFVRHLDGFLELFDGVTLGDEMTQIHLSLRQRVADQLKVLPLVHVEGLEVQLMLLVQTIAETDTVLHQRMLDHLSGAARDGHGLGDGRLIAEGKKDDVHHQKEDILVAACDGDQAGTGFRGDASDGQGVAEDGGAADDEHDDRR